MLNNKSFSPCPKALQAYSIVSNFSGRTGSFFAVFRLVWHENKMIVIAVIMRILGFMVFVLNLEIHYI